MNFKRAETSRLDGSLEFFPLAVTHGPKPPNSLLLSVRVGVRECYAASHKPSLVLEVVIFFF